ncbi:MAG: hypothetical protein V3V08_11730 [Nannocystaceae bacterium]
MTQVTVTGIPIYSAYPNHYLEFLAHLVQDQFGDRSVERLQSELAEQVGYRPGALDPEERSKVEFAGMLAIAGWFHHPRLEQLIHREWLTTGTNEFDAQLALLARLPFLHTSRTIDIAGAGVCRLASYLAMSTSAEHIRCTDLSLVALYFGRLLMEGRGDALPGRLRKPRILLEFGPDGRLEASAGHRVYHRHAGGDARISYAATDLYHAASASDAHLLCLFYVLDAPSRFDTMLIRVCQRLKRGQRILLLTAISDHARDPRAIMETLACERMEVDRATFERLPYSLSRCDFAHETTTSNVLVVEATRTAGEPKKVLRVFPTCRIEHMLRVAMHPLVPGQRYFPFEHPKRIAAGLKQAFRSQEYCEFAHRLSDALGVAEAELVTAYLCAREFMVLTYLPDNYTTRSDLGSRTR